MEIDKKYLSIKEIAEILSVSEKTVRRWIKEKQIPTIRILGCIRVPKEALDKFVKMGYNISGSEDPSHEGGRDE